MRVLLDTSYLFDFMDRPGKFPDSERRILAAAGTELYVSAVSIWEIRLKHNARHPSGAQKSRFSPKDVLEALEDQNITFLPMTMLHADGYRRKPFPTGARIGPGSAPQGRPRSCLGKHWLRKYFFSPQSRELTCPALPIGKDSAVEAGHLTALFPKPGCPSSGLYSLAWN